MSYFIPHLTFVFQIAQRLRAGAALLMTNVKWPATESRFVRAVVVALCGFVALLPTSVAQERMTSEQIRQAAKQTMDGTDFRSVRRRLQEQINPDASTETGFVGSTLESIGESIGDFFKWLFSPFNGSGRTQRVRARPRTNTSTGSTSSSGGGVSGFGDGLAKIFLWTVLIGLVIAVIWLIASFIRVRNPHARVSSDGLFDDDVGLGDLAVPPGERAVSTYEGRAIQMAREGNYGLAIRELLVGSMSWIERAGMIRFRKGLTNRDYARAVWRQQERRAAFTTTAITFERVFFGRREPTAEMFDECLTSFQGAFREEETTTAAV